MVKFIHCADVHLDSPFKSRSHLSPNIFKDVERSTYESFMRLVDYALNEAVDFIIIAGDVFDQKNRTLRAEVFLKEQFERLEKEQIFVYIAHGNHDALSTRVTTSWPKNVTVFSDKVETYQTMTKHGEVVYLHGFSYQEQASYENKIDMYPSSQGQKGLHIGVLHGTYSKSTVEQRYTEFRLEDLNSKLYHYWALGHIHERQQLSDLPPIHYPGNIQGRHFKELGEKGFLVVEGDELKLETTFVPTQFIRFEKATIETDQTSKQALYETIQAFKSRVRKEGRAFYQLTVLIDSDEPLLEQDVLQIREMVADYEEQESQFVFIETLTFKYKHAEEYTLAREFSEELLSDKQTFDRAMEDLYLHPKASKYLDNYQTFDAKALIERAEILLNADLRGDAHDH